MTKDPNVFFHNGGKLGIASWLPPGWYYHMPEVKGASPYGKGCGLHGFKHRREAERARQLTLRHLYWHQLWDAALKNMPGRRKLIPMVIERALPPTSIGDIIKGLAQGKIHRHPDGYVVYEDGHKVHLYGQQNCLTRIMQYTTVRADLKDRHKHRVVLAHNTVYSNWRRGSQPKDKWRRELLKKLAGPKGKKLAIKLLKQQGFDLEKHHYE